MNYKSQSWWDRFSTQIMSADGDDDSGGGGGDNQVEEGDAGEGKGEGEEAPAIDLTSTDPMVIQQFPADHKLNAEQISALVSFNPRKEKKEEPKVEDKKTVKKEVKAEVKLDPKTGKPIVAKVDPKAPVYDPVAKRWRDPTTKKLVAAPKGAKIPKVEGVAPVVTPKTTPDKVDKLAETVQKLVEGGGKPPAKDGDGPKPFFGEGGARPSLSAPDELMTMLDSEDAAQRKTAIGYMMTGVANRVMQEMFGAMAYMQQSIMKEVPKMIAGTVVQNKNSTSFYERHPQLNKPLLHGVVDQIGPIVAAEFQNSGRNWRAVGGGYTEDFMDEVALRTAEELGISANDTLQPEPEPVNSSSRRKPFFNRTGSARPPAASRESEKSADIMGVVGYRGH